MSSKYQYRFTKKAEIDLDEILSYTTSLIRMKNNLYT